MTEIFIFLTVHHEKRKTYWFGIGGFVTEPQRLSMWSSTARQDGQNETEIYPLKSFSLYKILK